MTKSIGVSKGLCGFSITLENGQTILEVSSGQAAGFDHPTVNLKMVIDERDKRRLKELLED